MFFAAVDLRIDKSHGREYEAERAKTIPASGPSLVIMQSHGTPNGKPLVLIKAPIMIGPRQEFVGLEFSAKQLLAVGQAINGAYPELGERIFPERPGERLEGQYKGHTWQAGFVEQVWLVTSELVPGEFSLGYSEDETKAIAEAMIDRYLAKAKGN